IEEACSCLACQHSRGYIRHLFVAGEMLGPILLSIHNLTYYQRLMSEARFAIESDRFDDFMTEKKRGWDDGEKDSPSN
ncbi:MAG: tRNA-guanine transglycosylase, partial [Rubripirellula sp.]